MRIDMTQWLPQDCIFIHVLAYGSTMVCCYVVASDGWLLGKWRVGSDLSEQAMLKLVMGISMLRSKRSKTKYMLRRDGETDLHVLAIYSGALECDCE